MDERAGPPEQIQREVVRAAKALGRSRSGDMMNRFLGAQMEGALRRLRRDHLPPAQRSGEPPEEVARQERRDGDG